MRSEPFRLDIPVEHFMLIAVLDGIRSRIGIRATLKLSEYARRQH